MGYSYKSLGSVLENKSMFENKKVLTLGTLFPYVGRFQKIILRSRGVNFDVDKLLFSKALFVDLLEAECCHSLDVSDYQSSEIICDLNKKIDEKFFYKYDVIYDAGTLEHLSNLHVSLQNIFDLLNVDGIYNFSLPCNNWVDHGFFQFSPTFFKDLCDINDGLHLDYLGISDGKRVYDCLSINIFLLKALVSSGARLNVVGIIKKKSKLINLDFNFIQAKYKAEHSGSKKSRVLGFVSLLGNTFLSVCSSRWIPLILKIKLIKFTLGCYKLLQGRYIAL